jgi:hypothetical protein
MYQYAFILRNVFGVPIRAVPVAHWHLCSAVVSDNVQLPSTSSGTMLCIHGRQGVEGSVEIAQCVCSGHLNHSIFWKNLCPAKVRSYSKCYREVLKWRF